MPRVSVLLSVRNGAPTLGRALDSILHQTYTDWEAVLVNDGSTDDTPHILSGYQAKDARFRVVHRPAEGLVSALNAGLELCTGEYLARMDADDVCYPDRLEKQAAHLDANPDTGIVSSQVRHLGNADTQQGYAQHVAWLNSLLTHEEHWQQRFIDQPLANPSAVLRREIFEAIGTYQQGDFPEDYEFWLRCLQAGYRMEKLPVVLLDWYDLPTRATRNLRMYREDAFQNTKARYWALWAQENLMKDTQVWIWGVGKEVRRKSAFLTEHGWSPSAYIDVTQRKQFQGKPVIHFSQIHNIPEPRHLLIYVSNRLGKEQIQQYLDVNGFTPGEDYHFMC
ncbi:MAG: glycosyltransferase family 2 protein [Bacteroidota bacterium]